MNKEEFLGFCVKNNLPLEIEFEKPWYPKPIEVSKEDLNNTKRLIEILNQAIFDDIVYGCSIFHITND